MYLIKFDLNDNDELIEYSFFTSKRQLLFLDLKKCNKKLGKQQLEDMFGSLFEIP